MKQSLRILIMVLIAAVCIAGGIILRIQVRQLQTSIAERIAYIENVPAKQQRMKQLQEQLTSVQTDLKRLSGTLVSRDDLSGVIASISRAAQLSGVAVQIPQVENTSESSGLLEDVRMQMNAVGSPSALIAFLYRVEHLPYVIRMASWTLDTTFQSSLQSFVGTVPPDSKGSKSSTGSALGLEVVISLKKQ